MHTPPTQQTHLRTLLMAALTLCLLFTTALPGAGQQNAGPVLPPPPTWDDAPLPALPSNQDTAAVEEAAAAVMAECTNCTYLPALESSNGDRSRAQAIEVYTRLYLASENVDFGWIGNVSTCDPGTVSANFINAMKMRINYYREMAGMPEIQQLTSTYNTKDQAAALIMSRNNALNHNPPTNWACYSASGVEGANNSNLALGISGPEAIDGYIQDPGDSNKAMGHRRWILLPQTTRMGTGDIPHGEQNAANALWVFDSSIWAARPLTRYGFVAWPPPGYVPHSTVYARWSFSIKDADFSASTVTVTSGGVNVPVTRFALVKGYGENTLVWQINGLTDVARWPRPTKDTAYTVEVKNVKVGGVLKNYKYTVIIFDAGQ